MPHQIKTVELEPEVPIMVLAAEEEEGEEEVARVVEVEEDPVEKLPAEEAAAWLQ
jgi:hypothetical protein